MDQRIAETIVRIVLQEIYKDGKVEAYERETLKKVLDQVGIEDKVFRTIHKEVSISAKKMKIVEEPLDHKVLLQRLNQRLRMEVTPKVCKEIIDLFRKEFSIEKNPILESKVIPQLHETSKDIQQQSIITTLSLPKSNKLNILCEQSPNYSLACYLLGSGSIFWVIFFSMIPVLINLNIGDVYIEYKHLAFSSKKVQAHVIHSGYARMQGLESEVTEVHYRYTVNHKNFTGYSYLTDFYPKQDHPLVITVGETAPNISRIVGGSFAENSVIIYIPILLLVSSFVLGLLKSRTAKNTNVSDIGMLDDSKLSIFSHFIIRRASILIFTLLICYFTYLPDLIFNILLPITSALFLLGIIIVVVWASSEER
ncbi:MAG: hypothetical protein KC646_00955 [Candidatus Cloacimonetes bacterium]|nr:hypothetical protein [Candidatus Cloacimonadota bacterium]